MWCTHLSDCQRPQKTDNGDFAAILLAFPSINPRNSASTSRWNARGISPLLISPTKQHRGGVHRVLSFSCVITRVDRMPRPPSFPKPSPHGIQRSFFLVPIKSLHREAAKIRENTGSRIVLDVIFIATRKF